MPLSSMLDSKNSRHLRRKSAAQDGPPPQETAMIERLFRWFGGRKARSFTPRSETSHLTGLALETLSLIHI